MSDCAYWIDPRGKANKVDEINHITMILNNPTDFGFKSKDELVAIYKKHKEPVGHEGKAREEIMLGLIDKGWIRCRYFTKVGDWHCQMNKIDKKKKSYIENWLWNMKKEGYGSITMGLETPVILMGLNDRSVVESTINDASNGNWEIGMAEQKKRGQIRLSEIYGNFERIQKLKLLRKI